MKPFSNFVCAILLGLSSLFTEAQAEGKRKVIGYTKVTEAEGVQINLLGNRLVKYGSPDSETSQLGFGIYLRQEPDSWGWASEENNDWYCVVEADPDTFAKARKSYIPKDYQRVVSNLGVQRMKVWYEAEYIIVDYIVWASKRKPNPEEVIRFAYIPEFGFDLQMLIPADVLKDNVLDLWTECYDTKEKVKEHTTEAVNWDEWVIQGTAGMPSI
ncbi:hypothetical protein LZ554_000897 [Drepanopeziza brunnea f. sp. 'monogermtubi']|nr:hypothetical protein LZ554_000897 [Drepanopeziza brunnea f. sp. 'monogermtubi']